MLFATARGKGGRIRHEAAKRERGGLPALGNAGSPMAGKSLHAVARKLFLAARVSGAKSYMIAIQSACNKCGKIDMYTFVVLFGDRIEIKISLYLSGSGKSSGPHRRGDSCKENTFYIPCDQGGDSATGRICSLAESQEGYITKSLWEINNKKVKTGTEALLKQFLCRNE